MTDISFNIIGAGAIGHLWHCFLTRAGYASYLFTKNNGNPHKICIRSPIKDFYQTINYQTLYSWKNGKILIMAVKAYDLQALCKNLQQNALKPGTIILMMNGLGLVEIARKYFPDSKILQANITHGAYLNGHYLNHTGLGETSLGNYQSDYTQDTFDSLIKALDDALPKVSWQKHHQQKLYLKLVVNSIINPLTAINNATNQCVLQGKQLSQQAEGLLLEIAPLFEKLMPNFTYQQIKLQVEMIAQKTCNNFSSMQQDIKNGRTTEIDFINGYLVKYAETIGVKLNKHQQVIDRIKALSNDY